MNLSTNDFENRELSIEELDTIAAGGLFGSIVHGIESVGHSIEHFFTNKTVDEVLAVTAAVIGTAFGGWANSKLNPPSPTRLN